MIKNIIKKLEYLDTQECFEKHPVLTAVVNLSALGLSFCFFLFLLVIS